MDSNNNSTVKNRVIPSSYKFTSEEMRILNECNTESFYSRSLPLCTILGFGTYSAISKGYWKPSPRFGVLPKMSIAVFIGYCIGKISYQKKCAEKLMNLPDSYLGQLLRDKKDGKCQQPTIMQHFIDNTEDTGAETSSMELERPIYDIETFRSNNYNFKSLEDTQADSSVSYGILQTKNTKRNTQFQEFSKKLKADKPNLTVNSPKPSYNTNKYGDVIE